MGEIRCTRRELAQGVEIPLDERTKIIVHPDAVLGTLLGRAFEPGRSFPLPRTLDALRDIFGLALACRGKHALVVAHTDQNDADAEALSEARASTMAAWLEGDPEPWLEQFDDGVAEEQRWGPREDRMMLRAVPGLAPPPDGDGSNQGGDPLVRRFQVARGLQEDGIAGPVTRKQLILDYFAVSQRTRLAAEAQSEADDDEATKLDMTFASHAAGDSFTLADVASARASAAQGADDEEGSEQQPPADGNEKADPAEGEAANAERPEDEVPQDARIDFFFFFAEAGIEPAPGTADGPEYAEWIKLATLHREFTAGATPDANGTQLRLRLLDKTGSVRHAERAYEITGPESFSGVTDSTGALDHDNVPQGIYQLKLTLEFFEGADKIVDEYTSPILVLPGDHAPQVRMLGVVPRCVMARLRGMLFDTNKAFLLPSAMEDLKKIRIIYEQNNPSNLLVVGHTDTAGDASINDPLSVERAKSTLAYLEDDVDTWLGFYESGVPQSRRWGEVEDAHMIRAMLDFDATEAGSDIVLWFQKTRGLAEDSIAGPETRGQLIKEYMALDGVELDSGEFQIEGTHHGCGENFPVDDTGEELDSDAQDEKEDAFDRRVELFFFDTEFGVAPAPTGENSPPGSTQYPTWRKQARLLEELERKQADRPCHFSFTLVDEDDTPLANEIINVDLGDGEVVVLQTDADGFFAHAPVPAGDFLLTTARAVLTIPALPVSEVGAKLLARVDAPEP